MRVLQVTAGFFGLHRAGLQQENAGDDLQAVGDPVLHLLHQHFPLAQQAVLLQQEGGVGLLDEPRVGHVIDGQQDAGAVLAPPDQLLRVHHQPSRIHARAHQVGLIVADLRPLQEGVLQHHAQLRDVPFAAAEVGQDVAVGLILGHAEGGAEGWAGRHHPQVAIEQQQRKVRGVDQRAGQARRVLRVARDREHLGISWAAAGSRSESLTVPDPQASPGTGRPSKPPETP